MNLKDRSRRLIRADGSEEQLPEPITNSRIATMIGAGALSCVNLRHMGPPLITMLVDDNSHEKQLPVNETATALYHANCWPGTTQVIRGDVVVCPDDDFAPKGAGVWRNF